MWNKTQENKTFDQKLSLNDSKTQSEIPKISAVIILKFEKLI